MKQHFKISGSCRTLPKTPLQAEELDRRLGLSPGWTAKHTGVLTRWKCSGPEEALGMTRTVCEGAMQEAGLAWKDLGLIVDASLCVQQPIPCNAALIQAALGEKAAGIPGLDVHASCLSFLTALYCVNGLLAAGSVEHVLIVCVETPLQGVNWDEPESACLMGDAAVAFVLSRTEPTGPCDFRFETFAEGVRLCEVRGGGHRLTPMNYHESRKGDYLFHMDGKGVHRLASRHLPGLLASVLKKTGLALSDLEVVPHQASGPALEYMRRRLGMAEGKFHSSIARHGNLVAAGIPFVLDAARRVIPAGSRVLAMGTAAGYTQAAAIFRV